MTIKSKLLCIFMALGATLSLAALFAVLQIESGVQNVGEFHGPALQQIQAIEASAKGAVQESYAYLVSGDVRDKKEFLAWAKGFDVEAEKFSQLARLDDVEEKQEKVLFEKIRFWQGRLQEEATTLFQEFETKGAVERETSSAYEGALNALVSSIEVLVKLENQEIGEAQKNALRIVSDAKWALYVLALLAVGLATVLGYATARGLTGRISQLGHTAEKIGQGEFDTQVDLGQTDEIGKLGNAVNTMARQLQEKFAQEQQLTKVTQLNLELKQEVTERKHAEEALRISEAKYADLFENAPDIFLSVSTETGKIHECNKALTITTGFSKEEIIGKPVSSLYAPEDRQKVLHALEQFKNTGAVHDLELQLLQKDGGIRHVMLNASAIRDEEGHILFTRSVLRDVTQQKQAAQAVLDSEIRYRGLVDHSPFCIHEINLEGLVTSMNPAGLKMLCLREERDILGKRYLDFVGEQDRERIGILLNLATKGQSSAFEFWVDTDTCFQSTLVPINNSLGTVVRIMGFTQNISEQKKTEHMFKNLVLGTASSTGGAFFDGFIEKIALALGVRFALVTELMGESRFQLRTLARWHRQVVPGTMEYPISGTPCEVVLKEGSAYYSKGVQELFPDDEDLKTVEGESYLGVSLRGQSGETIGHLCVVHDQPLADPSRAQSILAIFGARASAELERLHVEQEKTRTLEAVYESEERLAFALDATREGVWDWDITTDKILVNKHWMESLGYPTDMLEFSVSYWKNLLHPDDRSHVLDVLKAHMDGITPVYECENRLLTKSGEYRWNLDRGKVVHRDKNGQPLRMVGTDTDISERKLAENQLKKSYDQLQKMTAQLEAVQEKERKRIARELHDEFGQALTALNFDLSWITKQLAKEVNTTRMQPLMSKLGSMSSNVVGIIQSMRRIASSLRPSILDDLGLVEALEWELRGFQERTGIGYQLDISQEMESQSLSDPTKTALYRISQEFLTNVIKHAQASQVHLCLTKTDESLIFECKDNGKGIAMNHLNGTPTLGIVGMKERTMSLGGHFSISGNSGKGTTVTVKIPIGLSTNYEHGLQP